MAEPAGGSAGGRGTALRDFATMSAGWLTVLLAVRAYELVLVRLARALPVEAAAAELGGILADLRLVLVVSAILAGPVLLLSRWAPRAARRTHRAGLALLAVTAVALSQYFAVAFVPLGADLFGYSWAEIQTTVRSSGDVGIAGLLTMAAALFASAALTLAVGAIALRRRMPRIASIGYLVAAGAACAVPGAFAPTRQAFASDDGWYLAQDKLWYFGAQAARHARLSLGGLGGTSFGNYPLLHRAPEGDVLGPLLRPTAKPPNIVLVIVEGLGRDFVGAGARWGGFTPFLDSLSRTGLFWENFLSTAGRTFAAPPSLLGSLPFGRSGFMDLKASMPPHLTLVSLLRERGYATNWFSGTAGHFDFIDLFMERQGIGRFVDESNFGTAYRKQPAGTGGESWGYPDDALFTRSFESLAGSGRGPRLDVYLTITSHEPFIPPHREEWTARFEQRLAALRLDPSRAAGYLAHTNVFSTLLYTDDAIRRFMGAWSRRADYGRTIFIFTGDHRLVPVPPAERIDRYRVPFIIASPLVIAPRRFASVSSHLDLTPTLLAHLAASNHVSLPDSVPWLGSGIDTARVFRNVHALALMRVKNGLDEYIDGDHFLSEGQLFRITSRLGLEPVRDAVILDSLLARLDRFRDLNRFVTSGPHIVPASPATLAELAEAAKADSLWRLLRLDRMTPPQVFEVARAAAIARDFARSRILARRLLRDIPGYHDARVLLGRTFGWDNRFDEGREILEDLVRRAPEYADGYRALVDLERWAGKPARSMALADSALRRFPRDTAIIRGREMARRALAATLR